MMKTSNGKQFIIKNSMTGLGLFAAEDINQNELLFELTGEPVTKATRTSIQLDNNLHIENDLGALVNHSCMANAVVDKKKKAMISTRAIKQGEEITFNYNENEDALASPFICGCCGKVIQGKTRSTTTKETSE